MEQKTGIGLLYDEIISGLRGRNLAVFFPISTRTRRTSRLILILDSSSPTLAASPFAMGRDLSRREFLVPRRH